MSWQRAQTIARAYIQRLGLEHVRLDGARVQLSEYEDQASLDFLQTGNTWTLEFHQMVNKAYAREMKQRGAKVEFVALGMAEYFEWLSDYNLENNAGNRAQFISWKTAPEPKPKPRSK